MTMFGNDQTTTTTPQTTSTSATTTADGSNNLFISESGTFSVHGEAV